MNFRTKLVAVTLAVCVIGSAGVLPASAEEALPASKREFSPSQMEQAYREFENSSLPRDYKSDGGTQSVTFHLPQGVSLTLARPEANSPKENASRLGAGKTRYGYWFSFNQFDQNALSNVLVAGALTAGICAIPAVGQVACALAGVVVGLAVTYIHRTGVCSRNRTLYWYDVRGGSVIQCRTSAPK